METAPRESDIRVESMRLRNIVTGLLGSTVGRRDLRTFPFCTSTALSKCVVDVSDKPTLVSLSPCSFS